jgi:hypothetical protein
MNDQSMFIDGVVNDKITFIKESLQGLSQELQQTLLQQMQNSHSETQQHLLQISEQVDGKLSTVDNLVSSAVADASQQLTLHVDSLNASRLATVEQQVEQILREQFSQAASQDTVVEEASQNRAISNAINAFKSQLNKDLQTQAANLQTEMYRKFAIYADSMGGGGSVAVQYADGGTMNGSLNVNGQILSGGVDISEFFGGGTATGAYLPLSGGTLTGSLNIGPFTNSTLSILEGNAQATLRPTSLEFFNSDDGQGTTIQSGSISSNVNLTLPTASGTLLGSAGNNLITMGDIGATTSNGITLTNQTPATVGTQVQVSPASIFEGQGWKTTATAGSRSVRFRQYVLPIVGTTAPAGMLVFQSDINNANTWTNRLGIGFGSIANGLYTETGGGVYFALLAAGNQNKVCISCTGLAQLNLHCNGGITHSLINNASQGYIQALNTGGFAWSSTSTAAGTADLILLRSAAATLQLGVNNATTATNQTIKAHNVTTGTGANLILNGGTGSVASGIVTITSPTYSGGTTTTTKPTFLVEPTGATSTNWSTNGTLIGANALSAFVGNLIDAQINGVSRFAVTVSSGWTAGGNVIINPNFGGAGRVKIGGTGGAFLNPSSVFSVGSTTLIGWTATSDGAGNSAEDLILRRAAAATLQLGTNAASGTNQTIKACNGTAGSGADLILSGGTGTTTNGNVRFGTHSAWAAEMITGYITIKDESGTLRKIAVIS